MNNGTLPTLPGPIGIFDSGYGGLTILRQIRQFLPQYDYLYLGDNARAPYGTRSFEIVYEFTLQAVKKLFSMGCHLVILACNTASAKALKSIQEKDLPLLDPNRRVLGVNPTHGRMHRRHHADKAYRHSGNSGNHQFGILPAGDSQAFSRHRGQRRSLPHVGTSRREQ